MLYSLNSQQISNIADENYRIERAGDNYAVGSLATDTITGKEQEFSYDANGNLIFTVKGKVKDNKLQATNTRKLLWDEENRLLAISDNGFVSNYWYDAAGERTVKESFDNEGMYVNGALSGARTGTTKYTAYISPYLVLNNGGNYTKHIYVGSQRIVSKWGNSSIFDAERPTDADAAMIKDFSKKYTLQTNNIKIRFDSLGVNFKGKVYSGMNDNPESDALGKGTNALPFKYFYHPDHLGSSSLITDDNGYLVQNIQYVPFGEVFVEERNANWSTPYKFNGKEQDEETGLCYYGARYYDPRTSVWLSVDPLAEKYPNIGSYVYCAGNPVNITDPDGRVLNITTNKGALLFVLDDGKKGRTSITATMAYSRGIQWFEPKANNYMKLIAVAKDLKNSNALKHFSWNQIADFAEEDRWMSSYRQGGSGDWKADGKPGDGYLLVEVENRPYWADAIGQIPFAVDKFTDELEETGSESQAEATTIKIGQEYGEGQIINGKSDTSNNYDNLMIRRAINWAKKRYDAITNGKKIELKVNNNVLPQELSNPAQ